MYFPKFWAKGFAEGMGRNGRKVGAVAWGWSDISVEDASNRGVTRAQAALARIPSPKQDRRTYYEAGDRPFREPILEDISSGSVHALITRNSLGCEVLNVDSVAFADIDYIPPRVSLFARLGDLSGKKTAAHRQNWETARLSALSQWQGSNPGWSFRVYRTAGGLRLLATSRLLKAGSAECDLWLGALGNDALYQRLCRNQKSFRARLTPKPWRCGWHQPQVRFPETTPKQQEAMEKWLREYRQRSERFAVCQFLETMGRAMPIRDVEPTLALHDARTSATSGLPLA